MNKKFKIFLFILSFCAAWSIHQLNLSYIRKVNPENILTNAGSLVHNSTIWSIDNEFYLPQAKNLIEGHGLIPDKSNLYSAVRRTPGYSLFYAAHLFAFGEEKAHQLLPISQIILFALSVICLASGVFNFTGNRGLSSLTGILYGLSPFAIGNLYFTVTEGIHYSIVLFSFYFF